MKIVLFDVDDTLLKIPHRIYVKASEEMFKKVYGLPGIHEFLIEIKGQPECAIIKSVLEYAKRKGLKPKHTKITDTAHIVWANATKKVLKKNPAEVLPGIKKLLEELSKRKNIKLGILSGNSYWRSKAKIESAGLDKFFKNSKGELQGAFGNESTKRSQLIEIARKKIGQETDRFILVDDSIIGAKMVKSMKLPAIMVATGKISKEVLLKYSPYVFSDFGENRWKRAIKIIEKL
ncbi:hypothetical protein A2165_02820 [Candidatus Curtissbacteria bacterium RBG_13_40_7]|uniref:FCP1 homology domain-containing protein n=1 Tax=Candidatus Curtissbacteria bacterium RBG_13_40_7 TaxID=1797706 RepID=A0A1F5FWR8_9BACT|nr:MAG: hypothetical protein A2165_02820 [Candidatus Curtissbacteria bacterium RBG_13_40_7]